MWSASWQCSYQALFDGPSDTMTTNGSVAPAGAHRSSADARSGYTSAASRRSAAPAAERVVHGAAGPGGVGHARRRPGVVLQHPQLAVVAADQVQAGEEARGVLLDPGGVGLVVGGRLDHPLGHHARGHDPALAVHVGQEGGQRPGALGQAAGRGSPLIGPDQAGNGVHVEGPLRLAGAEAQAVVLHRRRCRLACRAEVALGQRGQQRLVQRPRGAVGQERLVPGRAGLVGGRRDSTGAGGCAHPRRLGRMAGDAYEASHTLN